MIKSKRVRWARHVACVGRRELHTWFCCGDIREGYHLEYIGVDGMIILKWVFKESVQRAWTGVMWLRHGVLRVW